MPRADIKVKIASEVLRATSLRFLFRIAYNAYQRNKNRMSISEGQPSLDRVDLLVSTIVHGIREVFDGEVFDAFLNQTVTICVKKCNWSYV